MHNEFHDQDAHGQSVLLTPILVLLTLGSLEVLIPCCVSLPQCSDSFKGDEIEDFAFTHHSSRLAIYEYLQKGVVFLLPSQFIQCYGQRDLGGEMK